MPSFRDNYSIALAATVLDRLLAVLRDHSVVVRDGSDTSSCVASLREWAARDSQLDWDQLDVRALFQSAVGFVDLAANVVSVSETAEFRALVPHLALLTLGNPSNAVDTPTTRESTHKLFELLVACWAIRAGAKVVLEDPAATVPASNPDIITTIATQRMLLACKETFSASVATHYQRICEGADQIGASGGDGFGAVVLHPRRLIRRSELMPTEGILGDPSNPRRYRAFKSETIPFELVRSRVEGLLSEIDSLVEMEREKWAGRPSPQTCATLAFAHGVATCAGMRRVRRGATVVTEYGPYPMSVRYTSVHPIVDAPEWSKVFLDRLRLEALKSASDFFAQ